MSSARPITRYYTLEHLPRPKGAQLQRIVRFLRKATSVEMIILFGSHAHDDWVEDSNGGHVSDFDIFVVVEGAAQAADHALWEDLQERARALPGDTPVSLVAHDIEEINRQLEQDSDFFREIIEDGIVLYDSGRHRITGESIQPVGAQEQPDARARFTWYFEKANLWLEKFENDLRTGNLNHAAFELHQAAETYYKTVLRVLTGSHRRGHDLHALGNQCSRLDPTFCNVLPRTNADEKRRLRLLDRAYRDARYEMTYAMGREDLAIMGGHVRNLRERTESVCREFLNQSRGVSSSA